MLIPTRALIPVIWNARQDLEELEAGRVPADGAGVGRRSRFTSWLSPARKHPSDILLHDSSCTRDKVLTLFHTHRPVQGNNVETRVSSLSCRGEKRRGRGWKGMKDGVVSFFRITSTLVGNDRLMRNWRRRWHVWYIWLSVLREVWIGWLDFSCAHTVCALRDAERVVCLNLRGCIWTTLEGNEIFTISLFYLIFYFKKENWNFGGWFRVDKEMDAYCYAIYAEIFIEIKIFSSDFYDRIL